MPDESADAEAQSKILLARLEHLEARCDALFAAVAVLSMQAGNSPDLVNNLMKDVSGLRVRQRLAHIADQNPNLATDLLRLLQPEPPKNPDHPES